MSLIRNKIIFFALVIACVNTIIGTEKLSKKRKGCSSDDRSTDKPFKFGSKVSEKKARKIWEQRVREGNVLYQRWNYIPRIGDVPNN